MATIQWMQYLLLQLTALNLISPSGEEGKPAQPLIRAQVLPLKEDQMPISQKSNTSDAA